VTPTNGRAPHKCPCVPAAVGVLAGGGYLVEAGIGASLVVMAHAFLRPIARRIDRQPATEESEVVSLYRFRAVCREHEEAHIRALVVQMLAKDDFVMRAMRSENIESRTGLVEVEAELQRVGRDDVALEGAVSRLSLEPSVVSLSWSVTDEVGVVIDAEFRRDPKRLEAVLAVPADVPPVERDVGSTSR